MGKKKSFVLVLLTNFVLFTSMSLGLGLGLGFSRPCQAEISPKVKVLGTLALYGTVSGALIGTATMAYGTSGRAIFQGASLGLYAGLLFGSYVIFTTPDKKEGESDYYPNATKGPYQNFDEGGSGGGAYEDPVGTGAGNGGENRFRSYLYPKDRLPAPSWMGNSRERGTGVPVYIDLFQYQF